ncbi:MAG: ribosome silencing factor [Leptolyngbya sp. SIO4C5]|uniref:ribosome silencing factor n=1 Tax=Sphaerothrix gracilis TaxID=3151835 RepID=UPI0013C1A07A|nr:ribosome silencing factor [Leptolyngbya sp. SIO4C5]
MADRPNFFTAERLATPEAHSATDAASLETAKQLAMDIAHAADDRKAGNIKILQVADVSYLADFFVIVTGFSNVQVRAIARSVEEKVEENWQRHPLRTEGTTDSSWILQDYGEVIVHIFLPQEREFYDLEAFWGHAQEVAFEPSTGAAQSRLH